MLHKLVFAAFAVLLVIGALLDERYRKAMSPPQKPGLGAKLSALLAGCCVAQILVGP